MSVKSSLGGQLTRAENLAVDSKGNRIMPLPSGYEGIRCKETPPHALSSPTAAESREERAERDGRAARVHAELTDRQRKILQMMGKLSHAIEDRRTIAAGEFAEWARNGYTLLPGTEREEERAGLPSVMVVDIVGHDVIEAGQLDRAEVAERLGISERQVKREVQDAYKKLREGERR